MFNYRLTRARRIIENAFRLFASVCRIFRKPFNVKHTTAEHITLAGAIFLKDLFRSIYVQRVRGQVTTLFPNQFEYIFIQWQI